MVRSGTDIIDVVDDAICIKSGKNEPGRRRYKPTIKVLIENCTVYHGHGGVVIGSEMSGGVRDVHIQNCVFIGTDTGLRFKSNRERGGLVENITAENIIMNHIKEEAILFDMYYKDKSVARQFLESGKEVNRNKVPKTSKILTFRNIHISNATCLGLGRALFMNGLPENKISNVVIRD